MCQHFCFCLTFTFLLFLLLIAMITIYLTGVKEMSMRFDKKEHCKCAWPSKMPAIGTSEPVDDNNLQWIVGKSAPLFVAFFLSFFPIKHSSSTDIWRSTLVQPPYWPLFSWLFRSPFLDRQLTRLPFRTGEGKEAFRGFCTGVSKFWTKSNRLDMNKALLFFKSCQPHPYRHTGKQFDLNQRFWI